MSEKPTHIALGVPGVGLIWLTPEGMLDEAWEEVTLEVREKVVAWLSAQRERD